MLLSSFQSGSFRVSVYSSINSPGLTDRWNKNRSPVLKVDYLKLLEETNPVDLEFRYVIAEKGDSTVVCLYFQIQKISRKNINLKGSKLLSFFASVVLLCRTFRILICGNLFAVNFPGVWFDSDVSVQDVLKILMKVTKETSNDIMLVKDLNDDFSANALESFGFIPYTSDLTMSLEISGEWKSINDYYSTLTKKYRKRAEKVLQAGEGITRIALNEEELIQKSADVNRLFKQVASKQIIQLGQISENYFYEYKKRFPDQFSIVVYYLKDRMIGFATYIRHEEILEMHYIGIDYDFNREKMLYFNMLFDGVERAINEGKRQLELGRTAREAKANLGATPVYFNDFIKVKSRISNYLIKIISNYFQKNMGDEWLKRHPFKN